MKSPFTLVAAILAALKGGVPPERALLDRIDLRQPHTALGFLKPTC